MVAQDHPKLQARFPILMHVPYISLKLVFIVNLTLL
jgi:hypothetical protein